MPQERPAIPRAELFALLARGHGARVAVLTPNRRLAQAVQRDFDRSQQARGLAAWESADVLPFGAFVARLWEDALYSELAASLPLLLTPAQEQALWDDAIRAARIPHEIFAASPAATQCREAWRIAHAWRLDPRAGGDSNEDTRAYLDWSARYERATREQGQTDAARLPEVVAPLLDRVALRKPDTVVLYGFDLLTPQMRVFLEALAARGCALVEAAPPALESRAVRLELTEFRDEVRAAARWARSRLEAEPAARIGVVVPSLARTRAQVRRLFADEMHPDHLMAGEPAALAFNVTLGAPLADDPLVGDALRVLALAGREIEFEQASRVIRSPFLAHAEAEMDARARLDARLRERAAPTLALDTLLRLAASPRAPAAPLLTDRLSRLAGFRKSDLFAARAPADWAKAFSEALRLVGFPGERILDSREHQALDRWHELLAELASLERVAGRMGYAEACERLGRLAREAIFQPQAPEVPVQVLGVLESAGIEFDHLWVMGLNDDAWPLPANPNPFIPVRLQRAAGVPQADPVASLELDRAITQGWLAAAREVVFSHARMRDESELAPSPLIAAVPAGSLDALAIAPGAGLRGAIRRAGRVVTLDDGRAPAAAAGLRPGGTGLFRDQAACPFRAVAHHRLGSRPLETPRPGLDAADRGSLLHAMLALVWGKLEDRDRLAATDAGRLAALLGECAGEAVAQVRGASAEVLGGRFGELERARLARLAGEWLAMELRRPDFRVVAREEKREVTFGGVTVNAKLDRMDRLARGLAVIDYKTGVCATRDWMGPRPEQPQLPMYARAAGDEVAAVAFGLVRAGEMAFKGIGREEDLIPGVTLVTRDRSRAARQYRDWRQLVDGWSAELDALGRAFGAGDARVDPKRGATTCDTCDQQLFCRVAEKAPFGIAARGEPDE
jgi:ATP-dependent helicase/nuclease subunit B